MDWNGDKVFMYVCIHVCKHRNANTQTVSTKKELVYSRRTTRPRFALSMVTVMVVTLLARLEILQPRETFGAAWCVLLGSLVYYSTLLLWRQTRVVFLDLACINQTDSRWRWVSVFQFPFRRNLKPETLKRSNLNPKTLKP